MMRARLADISPAVRARQKIERRIVRRVVADALAAGYAIDVFDGEETTLHRSTKLADILAAMFTTDDDLLFFTDAANPRHHGWVQFIYGNSGWDVIHDFSVSLTDLMKGAEKLAYSLDAR